jgi:malonate-semialdehyde dehydrogenase (acetylating) / methylmalonate-semialdehyde dehydrogenase
MDYFNPSTGDVIAQAPQCSVNEVELAIAAAKDAYTSWADTPLINASRFYSV